MVSGRKSSRGTALESNRAGELNRRASARSRRRSRRRGGTQPPRKQWTSTAVGLNRQDNRALQVSLPKSTAVSGVTPVSGGTQPAYQAVNSTARKPAFTAEHPEMPDTFIYTYTVYAVKSTATVE